MTTLILPFLCRHVSARCALISINRRENKPDEPAVIRFLGPCCSPGQDYSWPAPQRYEGRLQTLALDCHAAGGRSGHGQRHAAPSPPSHPLTQGPVTTRM